MCGGTGHVRRQSTSPSIAGVRNGPSAKVPRATLDDCPRAKSRSPVFTRAGDPSPHCSNARPWPALSSTESDIFRPRRFSSRSAGNQGRALRLLDPKRQCVGCTFTSFLVSACIQPPTVSRHANMSGCGPSPSMTASSRSQSKGALAISCHIGSLCALGAAGH
jgi:hypothetical protein